MSAELEILRVIQQAAVGAVQAGKPVNVEVGTVVSTSPLKIKISQNRTLTSGFLILSRNVTDHNVDMTVNHITEKMQAGGKDPSFKPHKHMYKGRKTFLVHNGLVVGDNVILIAAAGWDKYVVWDRVGV